MNQVEIPLLTVYEQLRHYHYYECIIKHIAPQTLKITEEALPRIILLTYLGLGGGVYNDEIYIDTF